MSKLNYKTYAELFIDIKKNIHKLPQDIGLVVGVPRSGMIPAYMIGFVLNTTVCSLDEFLNGIEPSHGERPLQKNNENILIIDDSLWGGASNKKVKDKICSLNLINKKIFYAAVYVVPESKHLVDFALNILPGPRIFQWNYMNHEYIEQSCFDIDGVLCVDPTEEENDDGDKYRAFLRNAKPLYIPYYKIGALVTSRLEKYRKETMDWLNTHNVDYGKLYMLDLPNKEERIRLNMHAKFKAEIYKKLNNMILFYESDKKQAIEIAELTGKTVFSVETDELINNTNNFSDQGLSNIQRNKKLIKKILHFIIPIKSWRKKLKQIYSIIFKPRIRH
jgi:uncharacterized HAD superfamily protein